MGSITKGSLVLLIVTITLGVLIGVSEVIPDVTDVPVYLQGVWGYIVTFFALAPIITIIAFGRNIYGYLVEYFKNSGGETYNFEKLGETLTLYIGVITTVLTSIEPISSIVPEPYNNVVKAVMAIGAALIVILDLVKQQFNILK